MGDQNGKTGNALGAIARVFGWGWDGDSLSDNVHDHRLSGQAVRIDTVQFPTDILEEGWVRAQIESMNGEKFARIVWPKREIDESTLIRLEMKALSVWNMRGEP